MTRHYGMDWLRIGAFAILILYHIGMVFVPWGFHVKSSHGEDWATLPMLAVNAWRLSLLFVVSGYASRALLRRSHSLIGFLGNRSYRLLVPLAFGVAVVVPPQPWIELTTRYGYTGGYWSFWLHDYFTAGSVAGMTLPTWNHLWFVGYLWVYTVLLCLAAALVRRPNFQRWYDRVFGTVAVLLLPAAWFVCIHAWWFPMVGETHALVGDWMAHLSYLPAFLFGFGLAGSPAAMAAIGRWWRVGAALAVAGYAYIAAMELDWAGPLTPARLPLYGTAHALQQWGGIVALIGIAERWWNHDRPIRPVLTEAVFPFYIAHQTIIIIAMWALLPAGLPGWAEFAILVVATIAGCCAFYLVGRSFSWLRPLVGLRRHLPRHRASPRPVIL